MFVFGQDSIQTLFLQNFAHLLASSSDPDVLISAVKNISPMKRKPRFNVLLKETNYTLKRSSVNFSKESLRVHVKETT